jgi:predicted protein tyrosine phosphatase
MREVSECQFLGRKKMAKKNTAISANTKVVCGILRKEVKVMQPEQLQSLKPNSDPGLLGWV